MNVNEEFDFFNKSIEDNLLLLEIKLNNININLDFEYKIYKINNIIVIFCHELSDCLKQINQELNDFTKDNSLNYNNILHEKNNIITQISNFEQIDVNKKINIINNYLLIYFQELNNIKELNENIIELNSL